MEDLSLWYRGERNSEYTQTEAGVEEEGDVGAGLLAGPGRRQVPDSKSESQDWKEPDNEGLPTLSEINDTLSSEKC